MSKAQAIPSSDIAQYIAERGGVGAVLKEQGLDRKSKEGLALARRLERARKGDHKTVRLDRGKVKPAKLARQIVPPKPRPVRIVGHHVTIAVKSGGEIVDERKRDRLTLDLPANRGVRQADTDRNGARLIFLSFPADIAVSGGYSVVTYNDGTTGRIASNGYWDSSLEHGDTAEREIDTPDEWYAGGGDGGEEYEQDWEDIF